jgi:hypothetical protein
MWWLCLLPLVFSYYQVIGILSDYGICWALNEGGWRPQIVAWGFPDSLEAIKHAFDWRLFEYEPRLTRPLSSIFELVDTPFRAALWHYVPPHPSLSLTWIFSLVFAPLLLFAILRKLNISINVAALAVAIYVANPGVISLEALLFRPSKALANVAILFCLWVAARQNDTLRRGFATGAHLTTRFAVLCFLIFICFFFDEVALVIYPAIVLLFPRIIFRSKATIQIFALLPIAYATSVALLLPRIFALAGSPPPIRAYDPNVSFDKLLTLQLPRSAYFMTARNIIDNSRSIIADSFGLIDPWFPDSPFYFFIFIILVLLSGSFIVAVSRREIWLPLYSYFERAPRLETWRDMFGLGNAWSQRQATFHRLANRASGNDSRTLWQKILLRIRLVGEACANCILESSPLVRAFAMLAVALAFEGILMTISVGHIEYRRWGLYYYGVFCVIFLLIAAAQLFENTESSRVLATIFAAAVISGTTFIFPATSQAYKAFHYYHLPADPGGNLDLLFRNKINRFMIRQPADASYLYSKTIALWRTRDTLETVSDVPVELTYVLYDLGLVRTRTACEFETRYFDLTWEIDPIHKDRTLIVDCRN